MSDTTFAPSAVPQPIPLGQILPWAIFAGLLMLLAIYFIGAEEGATSLIASSTVNRQLLQSAKAARGQPMNAAG